MSLEMAISPSAADVETERWVPPPRRAIRRALAHMRMHSHRRLPLAEVAAVAHMSQYHFSRSFHRIVGVTFRDHLVRLRLRNVEQLLRRDPSAPLRRVAEETGFGTLRNLQDHYRRAFGCPPSRGRPSDGADAPWDDAQDPSPFERETARIPQRDRWTGT